MVISLLEFIEYSGTYVFAMSDALTARKKGFAIFGGAYTQKNFTNGNYYT
ncbi:MAG: hypothetical protein ACK4K0_12630 [Flavobacteriales bacterium]